jgi:hypothetical protein
MKNRVANSVRACDSPAVSVMRKRSGVLATVIQKRPQAKPDSIETLHGLMKVIRRGGANFLGTTDVLLLALIRAAASATY